jgi:hypothetical protein
MCTEVFMYLCMDVYVDDSELHTYSLDNLLASLTAWSNRPSDDARISDDGEDELTKPDLIHP